MKNAVLMIIRTDVKQVDNLLIKYKYVFVLCVCQRAIRDLHINQKRNQLSALLSQINSTQQNEICSFVNFMCSCRLLKVIILFNLLKIQLFEFCNNRLTIQYNKAYLKQEFITEILSINFITIKARPDLAKKIRVKWTH